MSEDPVPYGPRDPMQVTFDRRAALRAMRHLRPKKSLGIPESVDVIIGAYPGRMVFATPHTTIAIEAFVMDPGMITLRRLQVDHLLGGFKEAKLTLTASASGFQLGPIRGPVREYREIPVTGLPEWIESPVLIASTRQGRSGLSSQTD
jgi:hypothetical protein